jgi:hypothetical protein
VVFLVRICLHVSCGDAKKLVEKLKLPNFDKEHQGLKEFVKELEMTIKKCEELEKK